MAGGDQLQERNDQLVSLLGADFQLRYEPNFAWKSACTQYQALCALRGFWPMGPQIHATQADYVVDIACNYHLANYHACVHHYDRLIQYVEFDGVNDYLYRPNTPQFDITGAEVYVATPGLTLGGWFYVEDDAVDQCLMSKDAGAPNKSYALYASGSVVNDPIQFFISDDGTNTDNVSYDGYVVDEWHYIVGRFNDADAGAELAIWYDETKTTATTARNSIAIAAGDFRLGSIQGVSDPLNGRASLCFICASALSDTQIWSLFQQTRAMFGV